MNVNIVYNCRTIAVCVLDGYVRSLANKTAAVHETIVSRKLDILALTEVWHQSSGDVCLRDAAPDDFAVLDVVREWQSGYGGVAVLYHVL